MGMRSLIAFLARFSLLEDSGEGEPVLRFFVSALADDWRCDERERDAARFGDDSCFFRMLRTSALPKVVTETNV